MTDRLDSGLRVLIDTLFKRQTPAHDPLALMPTWFESLRGLLPFSSGVFMPIDPVGGGLRPGYAHDGTTHDMRNCLAHDQTRDPYVIWQTALRNPDTVIRLSDVTDSNRRCHRECRNECHGELGDFGELGELGELGEFSGFGDFGDFAKRIPYFHAMAIVPHLNGGPLGVFAVHRKRRQRDFDAREMALFQWFVGHAATAIDYLSLQRQRAQHCPAAVLVMSRDGKILALNAESMQVLESLPDNAVQFLPGPGEASRIWRGGSEVYVVSTRRVEPTSMIGLGYVNRVPSSAALSRLAQRLRAAENEQRQQFAVTFEKLDINTEVRGEVFGLQLTPQQKRVAILLLKRYEARQIADILRLSPHTVREYVKEIYRRAGVHGYERLISLLACPTAVAPPANQPGTRAAQPSST